MHRNHRECTLDLSCSQLDDDELGEFMDAMEQRAEAERRKEALRKYMRKNAGWVGGMMGSRPRPPVGPF